MARHLEIRGMYPVTSFAGSVDWNRFSRKGRYTIQLSLPSREVWIEICVLVIFRALSSSHFLRGKCGLKLSSNIELVFNQGHFLRGKCGLKFFVTLLSMIMFKSLPSREVWIEILHVPVTDSIGRVTSFAGSVDWNEISQYLIKSYQSHFLRGKCGLKSLRTKSYRSIISSLPSREVWIEISTGCLLVVMG